METEPFPWRNPKDLASVIAAVRPVFMSLGIIERGSGCTKAEIDAAEQRMNRPLPAEIRSFYQAMRPTELFAGEEQKSFGFYRIDSEEFCWRSMERAEPADDWIGATGLSLGQSVFGDPFWWVEGHRSLPPGSIVLLDHEGALSEDVMFAHYARSFREFLAKIAYFSNLYPPMQDGLFQREYLELNPSAAM